MRSSNRQLASWDELLPPEIVSYIFKLAMLENIKSGSTGIDSSALVFGRVSRHWRDIAYSTASLWTSISLNVSHADTMRRLVPGVQAWLRRAGTLPLSVRLTALCTSQDLFPSLALLTETIFSFSPQFQYLYLRVVFGPPHYPMQTLYDTHRYIVLGEGGFPILETLEVDCPFEYADAVLAKMLSSAPALREFSIMNHPETVSVFPLPLARLRRLVCGAYEPANLALDIVLRAKELEECAFWFSPMFDVTAPVEEVMTHNRLRCLRIGPAGFGRFLSGLSLPALTDLTFDGVGPINLQAHMHGSAPFPQPEVTAFLKRSHCTLEKLLFSNMNITSQDLDAVLAIVSPTLKSLFIDGGPYGLVQADLLARMTVPAVDQESRPVLCPFLEHIRIHKGVLERDGYGSGMLDMLESRFYRDSVKTGEVIQLKSALIGGTFGPQQRKRVDKLKKDGFDFSFILEGNRYL